MFPPPKKKQKKLAVLSIRTVTALHPQDPKTAKVFVTSSAAQINELQGHAELFPQPGHPQNFMYVVVNPVRRDATVWYHAWCG